MESQTEAAIMAILNAQKSSHERKAELDAIEIKGGCERKYTEEEEPWPACYPYPRKRGIVEYYNCEDPSENRKYVGEWHCANF